MLEVWRRVVIGSAIVMYLAGVACAGGVLLKAMRVDERLSEAPGTGVEMTPPSRWAALGGPVGMGSPVAGQEVAR
jgi:hypothetical protein